MRRRIDKRFLPYASQPLKGQIINGASVAPAQGQHIEEKAEFEQVNVLYSLLENRYSKKVCCISGCVAWLCYTHGSLMQYPLSDTLMKPASNPTYYQSLLKELQEAPQRSWIGRMLNSWKGFLRFSWANWELRICTGIFLEEFDSGMSVVAEDLIVKPFRVYVLLKPMNIFAISLQTSGVGKDKLFSEEWMLLVGSLNHALEGIIFLLKLQSLISYKSAEKRPTEIANWKIQCAHVRTAS